MKKMLALLLCAALLCACGPQEPSRPSGSSGEEQTSSSGVEKEPVTFRALILENNKVSLLVEPQEGTSERTSADCIIVETSGAAVVCADHTEGTVDNLRANDIVDITYDGELAESYPAQIFHTSQIEVVGHTEDAPPPPVAENPMKEYDTPDYPEFSIKNYPQEEGLVLEKCWLVSKKIAQLDYKAGTADAIFRAARDDGSDISGVFFAFEAEWTQHFETPSGIISVRERRTAANAALYTWESSGWAYSLYLPRSSEKASSKLLEHFLPVTAELNFPQAILPAGTVTDALLVSLDETGTAAEEKQLTQEETASLLETLSSAALGRSTYEGLPAYFVRLTLSGGKTFDLPFAFDRGETLLWLNNAPWRTSIDLSALWDSLTGEAVSAASAPSGEN